MIKNDGVTLFAILSRHLIGDAADVVKACNFIGNDTCYDEVKLRLKIVLDLIRFFLNAHKNVYFLGLK